MIRGLIAEHPSRHRLALSRLVCERLDCPQRACRGPSVPCFRGRRAQVLHAVLMRNREWYGVKEIADRARVSPATASQVLIELERFDWVVSRGQGPRKGTPSARARCFAGCMGEPADGDATFVHAALLRTVGASAEGLVEKFAEVCAASKAEYAITHEAAGQRYAPFLSTVSQVRCRLLDGPAADRALGALDARFVDQGANLAVIKVESPGELLFREFVNGVWLASAVQVYLDLMCSEHGPRQGNGEAPAPRKDRFLMAKPATFDGYERSVHGRMRACSCDPAARTWPVEGVGVSGRGPDSQIPGGGSAAGSAGARRHARRGHRHRPADPGRHRGLPHASLRRTSTSDEVRAVDERKGPEAFMALADPHRKRRADGGRAARRRTGDCWWQG